jgi:hypothetical protein
MPHPTRTGVSELTRVEDIFPDYDAFYQMSLGTLAADMPADKKLASLREMMRWWLYLRFKKQGTRPEWGKYDIMLGSRRHGVVSPYLYRLDDEIFFDLTVSFHIKLGDKWSGLPLTRPTLSWEQERRFIPFRDFIENCEQAVVDFWNWNSDKELKNYQYATMVDGKVRTEKQYVKRPTYSPIEGIIKSPNEIIKLDFQKWITPGYIIPYPKKPSESNIESSVEDYLKCPAFLIEDLFPMKPKKKSLILDFVEDEMLNDSFIRTEDHPTAPAQGHPQSP